MPGGGAQVVSADSLLSESVVPSFPNGAAHELLEFVDRIKLEGSYRRIVVVLDEFDELPRKVFHEDETARAFFQTLRAIGSDADVGVVLVGGEKMNAVLSAHGDTLNKFVKRRVDYFSEEANWGDFTRLVRQPAEGFLEFDDDAVQRVFEDAAGHPYFTKMICREIAQAAIRRRDAFVSDREVERGIEAAARDAGASSFQHFWSDGITVSPEEQAAVSMARRKVLLALAQCVRTDRAPTEATIIDEAERFEVTRAHVSLLLREFVERGVMVERNGDYHLKVPFFEYWLATHGATEIVTQFADADAVLELHKREEEAFVKPDELLALLEGWEPYQGRPLSADDVRAWLAQFGDSLSQRRMFRVLQGLRFYGERSIRAKYGTVHDAVLRRLELPPDKAKDGLLISYFGSAGKSGPAAARLYRQENQLFARNVIERPTLAGAVEAGVTAVLFVDDFLGSGRTVAAGLRDIGEGMLDLFRTGRVTPVVVAVAGFEAAVSRVEAAAERLEFEVEVVVGDLLDDSDRCFAPGGLFDSEEERIRARELAERVGRSLDRRQPLGYEGGEMAVVFSWNCPNNSLPILWKASRTWAPLFRRV